MFFVLPRSVPSLSRSVEISEMRLLFGIVLGVALTIGAAYLHDNNSARADFGSSRPIVNWDVAAEVVEQSMQRLRRQITRLTGS
jgi:hypothetical protein